MTNTQSPSGEREFVGKGMARIFGAPISWIALFGALIGALAIVPLVFYPLGGGFASAGMVIFAPIAGLVLGPWAGFVAGAIGGIIGMFISPGSYPLGLVDSFFSGALLPLMWGLAHPRYRKIAIVVYALNIVVHFLVPYVIPGPAGGFDPLNVGVYAIAYSWGLLGYVVYLLFQNTFFRLMGSPKLTTRIVASVLYMVAPCTAWMMPWIWIYSLFLRFPFDLARLQGVLAWWGFLLPFALASGVVSALLVRAIEQTGLTRVTGSLLDRQGF